MPLVCAALVEDCQQPSGYVEDSTDCDDGDPDIHPGATETCDDIDNDCGDPVDDDDPDLAGATTWYADADGDGYGDSSSSLYQCDQPTDHVTDSTDCDDTDADVHPGALDICADGIDMDCDEVDDCAVFGDLSLADAPWTAGLTGMTDLLVAATGDLDADGLADFMVGAPGSGLGGPGLVGIYFGAEDGPATDDSVTITGAGTGSDMGASLATAGDLDADGSPDILLGSPGESSGTGAAYLFMGPITPGMELSTGDADAVVAGDSSHIDLGEPVAGLGDVDGDGQADVGVYFLDSGLGSVPYIGVFNDILSEGEISADNPELTILSNFTDDSPLALAGGDLDGGCHHQREPGHGLAHAPRLRTAPARGLGWHQRRHLPGGAERHPHGQTPGLSHAGPGAPPGSGRRDPGAGRGRRANRGRGLPAGGDAPRNGWNSPGTGLERCGRFQRPGPGPGTPRHRGHLRGHGKGTGPGAQRAAHLQGDPPGGFLGDSLVPQGHADPGAGHDAGTLPPARAGRGSQLHRRPLPPPGSPPSRARRTSAPRWG